MRAYEFVLLESLEGKKKYLLSTQANSIFKKAQSDPVLSNDIRSLREKNIDEETIKTEIAEKVIDQAAETNPTEDIQKKYMVWILKQFITHGLRFEEMTSIKPDLEYFHSLTRQQKDADRIKRDIGQIKNYEELRAEIAKSQNTSDDQFEPEPLKYKHSNQMKIVNKKTRRFGDLIIPESYEASCELGSGTRWCTASRETSEPFDDHSSKGPLYVWIPSLSKQVERDRSISRKFQFHFPSGQMTDEADRQLKPDEINYFRTSHPVLSEIFREEEANISQNAELAYDYAKNAIKSRWPEGEPAIAKNAEYAYLYAIDVINGKWPEAEETIAKNAYSAYMYAKQVIKGRWTDPKSGIDAEIAKTAEKTIAKNAYFASLYAKEVIKGRWLEAEKTIAQDAMSAYDYARSVIKGRLPEAEPVIAQTNTAYLYAVDVIKGRWPEGEPAIAQDTGFAYLYARDIIKGRWTDPKSGIDAEIAKTAEKTIARNSSIKRQYAVFLVAKGYIDNIEDFQ